MGEFHLVIDLSFLNRHVIITNFWMETVWKVLSSVRWHDCMVSVDVKDVYLQFSVHPLSHQFLCFGWEGCALQFKDLCFSLSIAPQVFTKIMAFVSVEFHKQGIWLFRYLDKWLLLVLFCQEALNSTQFLLWLCAWLGIRINFDKLCLQLAPELVFPGVNFRTPLKAFLMQIWLGNLLYHL